MSSVTTVKVSTATRDELKVVAERHGSTLEGAIKRLLRAEQQREMGRALAAREMTDEDRQWVGATSNAAARALHAQNGRTVASG